MFRPVYEPRTKAREYCDLAVNIYTGCNHGCVYCYAPKVLRKRREEFSAHVEPRPGITEAVRRQIERDGIAGKKIMLCFTCDPYPADIDTMATREVIKTIKASGNHVQILTKGGYRAERDFDLLDETDSFGVTISCIVEYLAVEPNAARVFERIRSLSHAKEKGISTWVSFEPVFCSDDIYALINNTDFIDLFRIGKLNYMSSDIDWAKFGRECEERCKLYGRNYYIKEDLRKCMEALPLFSGVDREEGQ
jgi:DNA repair photolyase